MPSHSTHLIAVLILLSGAIGAAHGQNALIGELALAPLDTRPACVRHPAQIGATAGITVVVPPEGILGDLRHPGDSDLVIDWLEGRAPRVDGAVVSIDMIATGGLVASRMPGVSVEVALGRLERLRAVRAHLPNGAPLMAFDTIQRIAPTTFDPASGAIASAIAEYVRVADQARVAGNTELLQRAEELRQGIPEDALTAYFAARARNLRVNLAAVDLVAEGIIDYLVLAQDDTALYGPHVRELADIRAHIAALGVEDRVSIHPGADEVAMTLIARTVLTQRSPLRVKIEYFPADAAEETQPYEDRPLRRSMASQIAALSGEQVGLVHDADVVLVILARATEGMSEEEHTGVIRAAAERISQLAQRGVAVAVADTARVNTAEPALITALQEHGAISHLAAYSGWGTPANTIGTALAQACAHVIGRRLRGSAKASAELAGRTFLFERLADDYMYLTQIRPKIAEEHGIAGYSTYLDSDLAEVSAAIAARMAEGSASLFGATLNAATVDLYGSPRALELRSLRAWLPWPRMFEVAVDAKLAPRQHQAVAR